MPFNFLFALKTEMYDFRNLLFLKLFVYIKKFREKLIHDVTISLKNFVKVHNFFIFGPVYLARPSGLSSNLNIL